MYMYCLGYFVLFGFMLCFYVCSDAQDQNTILLLYYHGRVIVRPYLVHPYLSVMECLINNSYFLYANCFCLSIFFTVYTIT